MVKHLKKFEQVIVGVLAILMALVVLLSTGELAWILVKDMITPPLFILEINELLEILGLFLLVLMGIELLETMTAYLAEGVIHVEVVTTVAMIALTRKVIVLEAKDYPGLTLLGIGVIIIALAATYYLVRRPKT